MTTEPIYTHESFTRQFRDALGMFATGVAVVTTRAADGTPLGLTVNSFNSVSLDPPLILWSLSNHVPLREPFEACEYYAVNVLAADQQGLSNVFASRTEDRFAGVPFDEGMGGAPLLHGTCARFECRNIQRYPGGDHVLFVSEVVNFDRDDREPLLYFSGKYRTLADAD